MMLLEEANSKPSKNGFPQLHNDVFETTALKFPGVGVCVWWGGSP